jgi:hypothetical protein
MVGVSSSKKNMRNEITVPSIYTPTLNKNSLEANEKQYTGCILYLL